MKVTLDKSTQQLNQSRVCLSSIRITMNNPETAAEEVTSSCRMKPSAAIINVMTAKSEH